MDYPRMLQVFIEVVESQSFARAARELGISPPQTTRAIAALEEHVSAVLLHRTTRKVRPTDAGARFLPHAKRILRQIDEATSDARGAMAQLVGTLVVTAPVMFGRIHIAPLLFDFATLHPQVSVRALFVDRIVDPVEEGIDVALRIARLPDSSLRGTRVGAVRVVTCAAPTYLASHGTPVTPEDLTSHRLLKASGATSHGWRFRDYRVRVQPRLESNAIDFAIAGAVAGLGIARVLSYQVERELGDGRLVTLLVPYEPRPVPIHLVRVEGLGNARARTFMELATAPLRARFDGDGQDP